MSYIAGNSSATVNGNMSDLYIFNSAEGSSYENQPYAKILTMSGGAAVTYTGVTLSSGGTATVAANTLLRNVTVASAGSILMNAGVNIGDITIESGGYVSYIAGQNFPVFSHFTVNAGGKLNLGNGHLYGRDNSVAANGLTGNLVNASASVNGVLYGVLQKGGAFNYYDIVFSNYTNSGGYTYVLSGCSILDGQAIKAGAGFGLGSNSYLYNANVTNGSVWIQAAGAPISLGGANTNITKGHVYHCAAAGTTNQDTNLYAANGVLYGVTLKTNGNWLRNLTIVDGLTINAPVVSNTGKLTIGAGGIGAAVLVSSGGQVIVNSAGVVNGLTVSTGASTAKHAYIYSGAVVNDLVIYGDKTTGQYDVQVSSGAVVNRVYHSGGGFWVYQDGRVYEL